MKTILYALIAFFLFGIVEPIFTNKANAQNSILLQSADRNVSPILLSQSAQIISNRLKDFNPEKFDVKVIPEKNQILVILTSNQNSKTVENLITQKGALAFYEIYNHKNLTELLNSDNQLFSLLTSDNASQYEAKIGCTSVTEIEKINDYLKTLGQIKKCKFVWDQHADDQNACLYALKTGDEKGALMVGTDIESIKCNQDKASLMNEIAIKFKQSATELWSIATHRNMNQSIAIVLDNHVIAAPTVRSWMNDGNCSITGNYTQDQVKYIAALGNNGELPLHFKVVK